MLNNLDLRHVLTTSSLAVGDDDTRAARALALAQRTVARRRRRRAKVGIAAAALCAVVAATVLSSGRPAPPPSAGSIVCKPDRTAITTPRVASLIKGAVVTIDNETHSSVVVRLGDQTAVVPPGVTQGQFPLSVGRYPVQCGTETNVGRAGSISVVRAAHA
jgi:ferric-dicitrate binding protein FerR (iron transport regulator)